MITSTERSRIWKLLNSDDHAIQKIVQEEIRKIRKIKDPEKYKILDDRKNSTYRKKHREELRKKSNENYVPSIRKNRYERDRERLLNNMKVYVERLRSIVIWHYSFGTYKCACCGCNDIRFLEINHVEGKGNEHRKSIGTYSGFDKWLIKNNLPGGFDVLCSNCNSGKFRNGGVCPHLDQNITKKTYIMPDRPEMIPIKNRIL